MGRIQTLFSSRRSFVLSLVALGASAIVLVWFGMRVILDSSDGRLISSISEASAPGFEAIVEKTPTALVFAVDESGQLQAATLLSLTAEGEGGVMTIPVDTDVYIGLSPGVVVPITLQALYAGNGSEPARTALGELLNLQFSATVVVKATDWVELVSSAGPLTVSNPSDVTTVDGVVLFPKGSIALSADQAWPYVSTSSADQSELDLALRQQAFWKAWMAAMGSQGTEAARTIPASDGLGRYISALSGDRLTLLTLPVVPAGGTPVQYRLAPGVTGAAAISPIVPLPEGAPGRRPRMKVLDGTGTLDNARGPAVVLAAGGGQIDVLGNAAAFGTPTTQIIYFDPAQLPAAERMRAVLGFGEVVESRQTNSALDLTVIIGDDYESRSPTTSSGGTGA
jgi:hypothetical protein